jgi:epoxyqueuosine reductase
MVNPSITGWIVEQAYRLGFAACGVVQARKFPELSRQDEWLARGYAGEMKYLTDPRRNDPQTILPGVQSVIACALVYNTALPRTDPALTSLPRDEEPRGWLSRYAWGDDYHQVMRAKLEALLADLRGQHATSFEARIYADTGPMNERVLAKYAGLGWLGKNTLLLNERLGSFFFLGVILTTLDLGQTIAFAEALPPDRCGSCRRCLDACPTNALTEPYVMDAQKCISYLTIELRGQIPPELREPMGPHIFGCDICQDVCPWNRQAPVTDAREFQPRNYERDSSEGSGDLQHSLFLPRLEWLGSLDEAEFREIFRGSPVKRTKWKGLMRNVCIALGNSKPRRNSTKHDEILKLLSRLATSQEPVVAESARWALSRIQ